MPDWAEVVEMEWIEARRDSPVYSIRSKARTVKAHGDGWKKIRSKVLTPCAKTGNYKIRNPKNGVQTAYSAAELHRSAWITGERPLSRKEEADKAREDIAG